MSIINSNFSFVNYMDPSYRVLDLNDTKYDMGLSCYYSQDVARFKFPVDAVHIRTVICECIQATVRQLSNFTAKREDLPKTCWDYVVLMLGEYKYQSPALLRIITGPACYDYYAVSIKRGTDNYFYLSIMKVERTKVE